MTSTTETGSPRRILYIDEDRDFGQLLAWALGQFGHQVTTFSNPRAALCALSLAPGDWDLVMTALDGSELYRFHNRSVTVEPFVAALLTPNDRLFAQAWTSVNFNATTKPAGRRSWAMPERCNSLPMETKSRWTTFPTGLARYPSCAGNSEPLAQMMSMPKTSSIRKGSATPTSSLRPLRAERMRRFFWSKVVHPWRLSD